jgi:peptide deformylase
MTDQRSPEHQTTQADPASLRIVHYPARVLRTKAARVGATPEVVAVADRMIELMHAAPGIGLAAPQVGLSWRLFVADVPAEDARNTPARPGEPETATEGPEIYIDPVISKPAGQAEIMEEGCLSLPKIFADVTRPPTVSMTYTDRTGQRVTRRATGLLARCWQHELDHLEGVLILDRMSKPDRLRVRPALEKLEQAAEPS